MAKGVLKSTAAAAVLGLGLAMPAFGQQSGLVNVDISNVRTEIAKDINVDVSQIPVTVQAPIEVAANVCGVTANVLAEQQGTGGATCRAENTSATLNQIVQQQVGGGQR